MSEHDEMETRIKVGAVGALECTLASFKEEKKGGGRACLSVGPTPPFLEQCSCKWLEHKQALVVLRSLDPATCNKVHNLNYRA